MLLPMGRRKRRSFGKLLRGAVKDVLMPTSMGLGLALGGCGGSSDKADVPLWAVMPPADAAPDRGRDYAILPPGKDAGADARQIYAIMPPTKDAARAETPGPDVPLYAILPPIRDAAPDTRNVILDIPIYAIMPIHTDAAGDDVSPDGELDKRDATPDTTRLLLKDGGPIFAILPIGILPPRG